MAGKSAAGKSDGQPSSDFPVRFNADALVDRFKQAIKHAGGNQVVSQRSGIPKGTIENLLRGTEVRFSAACLIAQACEVSIDWLWTGKAEFWPDWYRNLMTVSTIHGPSRGPVGLPLAGFDREAIAERPRVPQTGAQMHEPPSNMPKPIDRTTLERAIELVRAITKGEELSPADAAERIGNAYEILAGTKP